MIDLVLQRAAAAVRQLAEVSGRVGHRVDIDAHEVLVRSAAPQGLHHTGRVSANGHSRLMPASDGWVAMTLSRPDDWDLVPALLRLGAVEAGDWAQVESVVANTTASELAERAGELGLAVGALPDGAVPADAQWESRAGERLGPCLVTRPTHQGEPRPLRRVVDLSALWAGPLCASLLAQSGADVVRVEGTSRRTGPAAGGDAVVLDFADAGDRATLERMVGDADAVVSSARIRALQQLGLDPLTWVDRRPGLTWVAVSAYGLTGPWCNRIGYGDDTAVAGGLAQRGPTPMFVGDAIADPLTGLYAAVAALAVSASGGGVVDAALRDSAAYVARPVDWHPS